MQRPTGADPAARSLGMSYLPFQYTASSQLGVYAEPVEYIVLRTGL